MRRACISSVGMYVPERKLTNEELSRSVETSDEWIQERTGIRERRIASKCEANSDLSVKAVEQCLGRRGLSGDEVDLIIVATVTPDMMFPSTACLIQDRIGAKQAWGFDLSGACSGFLYALATGAQFVESGRCERVLVVGTDVMSSIIDFTDRSTCVLFGDGAGAVLLEPSIDPDVGILDFELRSDGSGGPYLCMPAGGSRRPATHETVEERLHFVRQDGRTVFKFAIKYMVEIAEQVLHRNNLTSESVDLFIPHQANLRIIRSSAERLNLRDEQVGINIDRYANTTAATIPIGLYEFSESGRIKKGDTLLLASFGAGFTWGSILLRWAI